ncbi:hypothetical protein [Sinomonas atrocyanea]
MPVLRAVLRALLGALLGALLAVLRRTLAVLRGLLAVRRNRLGGLVLVGTRALRLRRLLRGGALRLLAALLPPRLAGRGNRRLLHGPTGMVAGVGGSRAGLCRTGIALVHH